MRRLVPSVYGPFNVARNQWYLLLLVSPAKLDVSKVQGHVTTNDITNSQLVASHN